MWIQLFQDNILRVGASGSGHKIKCGTALFQDNILKVGASGFGHALKLNVDTDFSGYL